MLTRAGIVVVCFVLTCTSTNGQATRTDEGIPQTTVGQYGHFSDLVLPGGPWRAKVVTDDRTPIMLRIISTFPHGDSFRYELQYYGLAPGTYDLSEYLESLDAQSETRLAPILVEVRSVLPAGQVVPNALDVDRTVRLGGYRWIAGAALAVWLLGLLAFLLLGRKRPDVATTGPASPSLAELLRTRLESAQHRPLAPREYAELERMIIAWWRRHHQLSERSYSQTLLSLREDPSVGPVLRKLEHWMHRPAATPSESIGELLSSIANDLQTASDGEPHGAPTAEEVTA